MQFVLMIDVTDAGCFHPYRCVTSLQLCKCRAGRTWSKQLCSCSIYSWNIVMCSRWLRLKLAVFVCLSHFLKRSIFEILPNFSHTLKEERTDLFFEVKAQHSRGLASSWEIHWETWEGLALHLAQIFTQAVGKSKL